MSVIQMIHVRYLFHLLLELCLFGISMFIVECRGLCMLENRGAGFSLATRLMLWLAVFTFASLGPS